MAAVWGHSADPYNEIPQKGREHSTGISSNLETTNSAKTLPWYPSPLKRGLFQQAAAWSQERNKGSGAIHLSYDSGKKKFNLGALDFSFVRCTK